MAAILASEPRSPRHGSLIRVAVVSLLFAGCAGNRVEQNQPTAGGWFEDVTASSGLDFVHDAGPTGRYFMPQSMGSGAACLDFDGDGWLDIYLLSFGGPDAKTTNRLFRQNTPGHFVDATVGSGLALSGHYHGVAAGDVNNDGKPDLLLTGFGTFKLMLNTGNGKFADATATAGLNNLSWGSSAALIDMDRDGWLDIFVVNYLDYDPKVECKSPEGISDFCGPNSFTGTTSKLFRNAGKAAPQFTDISLDSGIGTLRGPGLGVTVADYDGDSWPDLFVSNDGQPNRLWINQRNSTFKDEAVSRGVAFTSIGKAYAGMGIAQGDVDGDGLIDLYVTHLGSEQNNLWRQGPRGQFRDRTAESGLAMPRWRATGFGTLMADFNNDGHLDIAVVNGKVFRGGAARGTNLGFWETYAEKNQLFANDGTGKFTDISPANAGLCGYWNVARGLICADFDNDGAPDLLITPIGDRARLLRNVAPNLGNWIKLSAFDPKLNRDAYGAEILVKTESQELLRIVSPAESYLSSGSAIAHFGLGKASLIQEIRVKWPNAPPGTTEIFPGSAVNQHVVLRRGEGKSQ